MPFEHIHPHILQNVNEGINLILDTLSTGHIGQAFPVFNWSCIMMKMGGSSMHKTEYVLKAIMHPTYGTHYRLRNISGNELKPTRHPSQYCRQSLVAIKQPLLVCLKWRSIHPLFFRDGGSRCCEYIGRVAGSGCSWQYDENAAGSSHSIVN